MDKEKLKMVLDCIYYSILIMSLAYCTAHVESAKVKKTYVVECQNEVN